MKRSLAPVAALLAVLSLPAIGHEAYRNHWPHRDKEPRASYRVERIRALPPATARQASGWHAQPDRHYDGPGHAVHFGACGGHYGWTGGALLFGEILHHSHGHR